MKLRTKIMAGFAALVALSLLSAGAGLYGIWRSKQSLDDLFVGIRGFIREKLRHFQRRGGQSGEVER